jgi:hypothetical protein
MDLLKEYLIEFGSKALILQVEKELNELNSPVQALALISLLDATYKSGLKNEKTLEKLLELKALAETELLNTWDDWD